MERHSFDPTVFDYTWKQNRLAKDKEALKNSLMNIIHKKPKKQQDETKKPEVSAFSPLFLISNTCSNKRKRKNEHINN